MDGGVGHVWTARSGIYRDTHSLTHMVSPVEERNLKYFNTSYQFHCRSIIRFSKEESLMEEITDKFHGHDSSTSSSDSDDDDSSSTLKSNVYRLFGREKPVHKILGGGKSADVLLWRNRKISGGVLAGATAIWLLFELLQYHLLTLVCHGLMLALGILFLWSNVSIFINKSPPNIPEISIPDEPIHQIASVLRLEINQTFEILRDIASGRDLKQFLYVMAGLWISSVIGSFCDFLTLFYIAFVLLHTIPVLYEKYEDHVDSFGEKAIAEIKTQYQVFDAKVLSKIPTTIFSKGGKKAD